MDCKRSCQCIYFSDQFCWENTKFSLLRELLWRSSQNSLLQSRNIIIPVLNILGNYRSWEVQIYLTWSKWHSATERTKRLLNDELKIRRCGKEPWMVDKLYPKTTIKLICSKSDTLSSDVCLQEPHITKTMNDHLQCVVFPRTYRKFLS